MKIDFELILYNFLLFVLVFILPITMQLMANGIIEYFWVIALFTLDSLMLLNIVYIEAGEEE